MKKTTLGYGRPLLHTVKKFNTLHRYAVKHVKFWVFDRSGPLPPLTLLKGVLVLHIF
jgi:hypothetical protein